MPTPAARTRSVYQLRVVLHGVSPLIWRGSLVPGDASVADVHAVLQIAFGWDGEHLHRFVIHGVEYGISYAGSGGFRDDPPPGLPRRSGSAVVRSSCRGRYHRPPSTPRPPGAGCSPRHGR